MKLLTMPPPAIREALTVTHNYKSGMARNSLQSRKVGNAFSAEILGRDYPIG
jgi:hypothetical protein